MLLVGNAESDIEYALLHVVEIHHARQQKRPHFRDRRPHRMPLFAENIPEHCRKLIRLERQRHILGALEDEILCLAGFGDAG